MDHSVAGPGAFVHVAIPEEVLALPFPPAHSANEAAGRALVVPVGDVPVFAMQEGPQQRSSFLPLEHEKGCGTGAAARGVLGGWGLLGVWHVTAGGNVLGGGRGEAGTFQGGTRRRRRSRRRSRRCRGRAGSRPRSCPSTCPPARPRARCGVRVYLSTCLSMYLSLSLPLSPTLSLRLFLSLRLSLSLCLCLCLSLSFSSLPLPLSPSRLLSLPLTPVLSLDVACLLAPGVMSGPSSPMPHGPDRIGSRAVVHRSEIW